MALTLAAKQNDSGVWDCIVHIIFIRRYTTTDGDTGNILDTGLTTFC